MKQNLDQQAPDPTFGHFDIDWPYDLESGLMSRHTFMEVAGAEVARARRYKRPLGLCVLRPADANVDDRAFAELSVFAAEIIRMGCDIVGRTGRREISILMPETDLAAVQMFTARARALVAKISGVPPFTTCETMMRQDDTHLEQIVSRCAP